MGRNTPGHLLALAAALTTTPAFAVPWSFGVMSDTQWKSNLDGENPGTVAVGIINQVNAQFIQSGVKFVVQVGDLVDSEGTSAGNINYRAAAAQPLYDAGIGFFPLRGNHEASTVAAQKVQQLFPQTQGNGPNVFGATDFSSPPNSGSTSGLTGLSYAFTYENARFVVLDQFNHADNTGTGSTNQNDNNIANQQSWINSALDAKPADGHAFVFSHKQLVGGNHTDTLFRSVSSNAAKQDAFITSLDQHDVGYLFTGHDHMHDRSVVYTTDGASASVNQIISASNSYKFYVPRATPNGSPLRQTMLAQELYSVGYYIVTVDGPHCTVDFYSADPNPATPGYEDLDLAYTPSLDFSHRESFGYSLNGLDAIVKKDQSYAGITHTMTPGDGYQGSTASIVAGNNLTTATILDGRSLADQVGLGWTAANDLGEFRSDVLSLWGMHNQPFGSDETDPFILTLSYNDMGLSAEQEELMFLAFRNANGQWVNAVDGNFGGAARFFLGGWNLASSLGDYGVDTANNYVWAYINHNSDFVAISPVPEPLTAGMGVLSLGALALSLTRRRRNA